jgi:hypothetical protein
LLSSWPDYSGSPALPEWTTPTPECGLLSSTASNFLRLLVCDFQYGAPTKARILPLSTDFVRFADLTLTSGAFNGPS